uniref:BSD domain-containing protein n=1 Tax=Leersia perrieri TaxID=77586 RepID=A0A0D9WIJ5_9ORYZ
MSWLARSIAATLSSPRGEPDPDSDADDESEHASAAADRAAAATEGSSPRNRDLDEPEEPEQPDTPSRGVKGDISELTETLTRRLWGVASFLAPPPPEPSSSTPRGEEDGDGEEEEESQSPRIAGIRSDLAEIGGRVRSGISMLQSNKAVAEISKIASSLLPFGQGDDDEGEPVAGVTEEVVVFVRHVSTRPETWLDFPLFISERYADDFELSDAQYVHALAMEHLVPSLADLKAAICSTDMSEACFWKIYFVLLHSKLNKQDVELLSTPQILQAREELLQSLQTKNKRGSEVLGEGQSSNTVNMPSAPAEEKVIQLSSIENKAEKSEVSSFNEPTSDILPDIESEKFPIATAEVEIIDKSVIEEELSTKIETKSLPIESKIHAESDKDEVDEWPDDDDAEEVVGTAGNRTSLGQEEDVSFSDLEDDDDDGNKGVAK